MGDMSLEPIVNDDFKLGYPQLVIVKVGQSGGAFELATVPPSAVVYHTRPGNVPTPERPREVRWIVNGLGARQQIVLKAKQPGTKVFPQDRYVVEHPHNSIHSGEARLGPAPGQELRWGYDVVLEEQGRELARLDPTVVVKDDP